MNIYITLYFSVHRLDEFGLLKRQLHFWSPRKPTCIGSTADRTHHIGIEETFPILLVLLSGIAISLFIFIFELHFKLKKKLLSKEKTTAPPYPFVH